MVLLIHSPYFLNYSVYLSGGPSCLCQPSVGIYRYTWLCLALSVGAVDLM